MPERKHPRRTAIIVAGVLVVVLVAGGLLVYQSFASKASATEYSTSTVSKGTIQRSVTGSGTLAAGKSTDVTPEVSGTVYDLKVSEGDTVKAGQVLFSIRNDSLDTAVTQAASEVTNAKAQVTSAKAQLASARSLSVTSSASSSSGASSAGSQVSENGGTGTEASNGSSVSATAGSGGVTQSQKTQQIASAQAAVSQAQAQLTVAQEEYAEAVAQCDKRTVTAPTSGTITSLNVTEGGSTSGSASTAASSSAGAGNGSSQSTQGNASSSATTGSSSAALVISDYTTSMTATINVTESDLPSIKKDQEAMMTFDALDGVTATGTVTKIATTGTESSGVVTFAVQITIPTPDSRLRPGMNTSATITLERVQDVLLVDNAAIVSTGTDSADSDETSTTSASTETTTTSQTTATVRVMTDKTKQTIQSRQVVLGLAGDTQTEVVSGLSEGDIVVTGTIDTSSSSSSSSSRQGSEMGMMQGGPSAMQGGAPPVGGNGGF